MPKKAKELKPIQIQRLVKPGVHPVGGVAGLLLKVNPSGSRSWVLRAMVGDRRRDIGLGGYPDVTLAGARDAARAEREKIKQGVDPVEERRKSKAALKQSQETRRTFRETWAAFLSAGKLDGLSKKTVTHWTNTVESYALPVIGSMVVSEIDNTHIEKVLAAIWQTKTVTAKKLRARLEAIFSFATVKKWRSGDNPARWKDNLKELFPKPSSLHKTTHYRAMPIKEAKAFISELRKRTGNAARALEFAILTAARSGEVRGATWNEIDLKTGRWLIPAERMKMDQPHEVPLSEAAIALIKKQPRDNDLVFPGDRGGQMSDMSLLAVLKRMGWHDRTTAHGFRSVFKGWAMEETDFPDFVSEMALAHSVGDDIAKAYKRSDLITKRLAMMREWAAFLGYGKSSGKVISMEARA